MVLGSFERLRKALAGQYALEHEIGSGGMAIVYLAQDLKHDRPVAVKVLRPDVTATVGVGRFLHEIDIAARLSHPHIVPLFDSGQAGTALFYVMPYLEGQSLRELLDARPQQPVAEAARILADVGDALAYAHANGVVHRDIKPENIMIAGRNAAVMDFGVAKAVSEAAGGRQLTTAGVALGTPSYMAPEQAAADPNVDQRVDLYALGVVAYEMLAGRRPLQGETPQQVLAAHIATEPEPITRHRAAVPPAVAQTIMRCLAKNPADRPQRADEVVPVFEAAAVSDGDATTTPPPSAGVSGRPWRLAAGLAAALVVIVAAIDLLQGGGFQPYRSNEVRQLTIAPGIEIDPAISPDGSMVAYEVVVDGVSHVRVQRVDSEAVVNITEGNVAWGWWPQWSPDGSQLAIVMPHSLGRSSAIGVTSPLGGSVRRVIEDENARVHSHSWCPAGSCLAYVVGREIRSYDFERDSSVVLGQADDPHSLAWSPDGEWIAFVNGNSPYIYSLEGNIAPSAIRLLGVTNGEVVAVTDGSHLAASPVWSPDGKSLLLVSDRDGTRDVYQVDLRDPHQPRTIVRITTGLDAHTITIDRAQHRLAISVVDARRNIWAVALGGSFPVPVEQAVPVTTGNQTIEGLDVSPDGEWLVYDTDRTGNQDIFRQRLPDGTPEQLTRHDADDFAPAWSHDGSAIAFHSLRSGNRDVMTIGQDGRDLQEVTRHADDERTPHWSPDGNRIAFQRVTAEGASLHVSQRTPAGWSEPRNLGLEGFRVRWSPDGEAVAYLSSPFGSRADVLVASADGTNERLVLDGDAEGLAFTAVDWDPSGERLIVKGETDEGLHGFWAVSAAGGPLVHLVEFAQPSIDRDEFATDGSTIYFTRDTRESDIHLIDLVPAP